MGILTPENATLAESARKMIGGAPRRVVLLIGTGVSSGMTKKNELCSWPGLVRALVQELPDNCKERRVVELIDAADGFGLKDVPTSVVLGCAHMVRDKLCKLDKWDKVIDDISAKIFKSLCPDEPWSRFFRAMGDQIARNPNVPLQMPLIMTTNYDRLLEHCLDGFTLTNPDRELSRADGSPPKFKLDYLGAGIRETPRLLGKIVEGRTLWTLHQRGRLENKHAFVHYIHGSAHLPSTVVFDPADYERVIVEDIWKDLASLWAGDGQNTVVVIAGVGPGLFDRHFRLVWQELTGKGPFSEGKNQRFFWLRASGDDLKESIALLDENRDVFPEGAISLVDQEGHDWYPHWINQLFDENTRLLF